MLDKQGTGQVQCRRQQHRTVAVLLAAAKAEALAAELPIKNAMLCTHLL